MKKVIATFLALLLTVQFIPNVLASEQNGWKQAYADFLNEIKTNRKSDNPYSPLFTVHDFDNDGIPELIVHYTANLALGIPSDDVMIYQYKDGAVSERWQLSGDIRGFYAVKDSGGLFWYEIEWGDEDNNYVYHFIDSNLQITHDVGSFTNLSAEAGRYATKCFYKGKEVTQTELERSLNILSKLREMQITNDNIKTFIHNYPFDGNVQRSNPCVSVFDIGVGETNEIGYSNEMSVYYNYNPQDIFPLIMINGNFVDKTGVVIRDGVSYATADFLKYNLGFDVSANPEIGQISIDNVRYFKLRSAAENLNMDIQYIDNINMQETIRKENHKTTIITIEEKIPASLTKYCEQEALELVKKEFDYAYAAQYPRFPTELHSKNLYLSSKIGRYYVIRADYDNYFILFNPYTGEMFERSYGLPVLSISPQFSTLFWLTQGADIEETEDKILYSNNVCLFSIEFPISWKDKFAIEEKRDKLGEWWWYVSYEIYSVSNREAGYDGTLFTIGYCPKDRWQEARNKYINLQQIIKFGETDEFILIYYEPSELLGDSEGHLLSKKDGAYIIIKSTSIPPGQTLTLIDSKTAQFIQGDWKVKEFLGFQMITKDDIEYPDGEKIIGKMVIIAPNLFSTRDFAPDYEKYVENLWWGHYNILDELSGAEFYNAYKVGQDITKIKDNDRVTVIQAEAEDGNLSGLLLIDVNHERLLLYLNCNYFELEKNCWTENDIDVSIYDSIVHNDGFYHVEYNTNTAELIPENEQIFLLMINGGFVPFPDIKIVNDRALTPLKNILPPLGAKAMQDSENQSIVITKAGTKISLKIGSTQADVNGETKELDGALAFIDGEVYVPIRFVAEAFGADVEYITDLSNGGSAVYGSKKGVVFVISIETQEQLENVFSPEEGLIKVKEASAAAYQVLLDYYKADKRAFDNNFNKDYDSQDIVFTGDIYGRYYVYRLKAFPNYNIFFNKYTGEIYSEHAGLPFLSISKGFINISWMYQ